MATSSSNVALGGSLLQHIDGHYTDEDDNSNWHDVAVQPGTRLAEIYEGATRLHVNSRHHQAVTADCLSSALDAAAHASDIIEAVESRYHRWVVGIQWHPERPEMDSISVPLFAAFVTASRG